MGTGNSGEELKFRGVSCHWHVGKTDQWRVLSVAYVHVCTCV